jgi:hypothetical protein
VCLYEDAQGEHLLDHTATSGESIHIGFHQASPRCFIYNVRMNYPKGLPKDQWLYYDLKLNVREPSHSDYGRNLSITEWAGSEITYGDNALPGFIIQSQLTRVLHGSCRKPHYFGDDGLARADRFCESLLSKSSSSNDATTGAINGAINGAIKSDAAVAIQSPQKFPGLLLLTGDQIYADDVAGPLLCAIHQVIHWLDFPTETLTSSASPTSTPTKNTSTLVESSEQLYGDPTLLYSRHKLLPDTREGTSAYDAMFSGARKPVFTSVNANNHLITLAEMISMYLLIWSPACWSHLSFDTPEGLSDKYTALFEKEKAAIVQFIEGLGSVRRVMAHLPVAMIFDDHDVTDDWNLTAAWEQAVYGNPLSKRIIGNSLIAYLLCQSWGNAPEQFVQLSDHATAALAEPGKNEHLALIETLIHYPLWSYSWDTTPSLKVLDTRTQRWRSERSPGRPSGLLDWESLSYLQQSIINERSVLLVAPAPVFGVKLIEGIQKVMAWLGQPLMVDAENWMAHPGTANTLLNMFCHANTPKHFVILSGDVHYSFAYQVRIRGEKSSPFIWQITSSGLRNTFPSKLLSILDKLNRWLYSPRSPLNWFTKRRHMAVTPYNPSPRAPGQRLANRAGVGLVELDAQGKPCGIYQLCGEHDAIKFELDA